MAIALSTIMCSGEAPKAPGIVEKDDAKDCPKACEKGRELECPETKDLVYVDECSLDSDCTDMTVCINGRCTETCEMVCEAFVAQGVHQGLQCTAHITSCEQIESKCR